MISGIGVGQLLNTGIYNSRDCVSGDSQHRQYRKAGAIGSSARRRNHPRTPSFQRRGEALLCLLLTSRRSWSKAARDTSMASSSRSGARSLTASCRYRILMSQTTIGDILNDRDVERTGKRFPDRWWFLVHVNCLTRIRDVDVVYAGAPG